MFCRKDPLGRGGRLMLYCVGCVVLDGERVEE